tara:strand:+ start:366 stop:590 length:225 start_codon:yes stop_codon:yes gene_type:complete
MLYQSSLFGVVVAAAAVLSRVEGMALESRATVKHWGSGCPQGISDFWVKVEQTKYAMLHQNIARKQLTRNATES